MYVATSDHSAASDSFSQHQGLAGGKKLSEVVAECPKCQGIGFTVERIREKGIIGARLCSCIESAGNNPEDWKFHESIEEKAASINGSMVPTRYIEALNTEPDRLDLREWEHSIGGESSNDPFAFFFGGCGTGKTYSAICLILKRAMSGRSKSPLYLPLYNLFGAHEQYQVERFRKGKTGEGDGSSVFEQICRRFVNSDFLVLDEFGQEDFSRAEKSLVFSLLDRRYNISNPTIMISNHCNDKKLSLDGIRVDSFVGKRISSRIDNAKQFHFKGGDMRRQERLSYVSQQDKESFMVPAKILTHDDNTHQIMTWLTRNPAFETVSTQMRKSLTKVKGGIEVDEDRADIAVYNDVWVEGDALMVAGPVCDHEDKKLYAHLVKRLADNHKKNIKGLSLQLSYGDIRRDLDLADCGEVFVRIRRQLNRLVRMSLSFRSFDGMRWSGPLITEVYESSDEKNPKLNIRFSHFMIAFYNAQAYTTFDKRLSSKLMGDRSAFYLFFASHAKRKDLYPVPFEKCKNLLGIPKSLSREASLRRIKKATRDLIEYRVLGEATCFEKNSLHPVAGPQVD